MYIFLNGIQINVTTYAAIIVPRQNLCHVRITSTEEIKNCLGVITLKYEKRIPYSAMELYQSENENESESDEYFEYSENESEDIVCTNMDPALAKLMGIMMEETVSSSLSATTWKPPPAPGLSNSSKIIPDKVNVVADNDYFQKIKMDIRAYQKLTERQLHYIEHTNADEKFQIISIYNELMKDSHK